MLALLTCSTSHVEDYEYDDSEYAAPVRRRQTRSFIAKASPGIRRRKTTNMVIGSPTGFRHEVHLGRELKPDSSYMLWDVERWREELAKRNLILPPVTIPKPAAATAEQVQQNTSRRSSFTPQKRKPVPSLDPIVPCPPPPHDVPLPPSPSTHTITDSESVPALDPSSRGPSMDERDSVSLPDIVETESDEIPTQKAIVDPVVGLDAGADTLQPHTRL
ncbi:hypothetical protein BU17DRAFT_101014 [Hysterangium stoloniferum]|nr:hypothetical protein BU17DRAFT_101014 [Hysterangium stoloniferum]